MQCLEKSAVAYFEVLGIGVNNVSGIRIVDTPVLSAVYEGWGSCHTGIFSNGVIILVIIML